MQNTRSAMANTQADSIIRDKDAQRWALRKVAHHLNEQGYRTRTGKEFTSVQVMELAKTKSEAYSH